MKLRPPTITRPEVLLAEMRGWRRASMGVAFGVICGLFQNLALVDPWIFWTAAIAAAAAQLGAMWKMLGCIRRLKRWQAERDAWSN